MHKTVIIQRNCRAALGLRQIDSWYLENSWSFAMECDQSGSWPRKKNSNCASEECFWSRWWRDFARGSQEESAMFLKASRDIVDVLTAAVSHLNGCNSGQWSASLDRYHSSKAFDTAKCQGRMFTWNTNTDTRCCNGGLLQGCHDSGHVGYMYRRCLHESLQEDLKNMQRFACLVAVLSYWTTHKLGFKDAVLPIYAS